MKGYVVKTPKFVQRIFPERIWAFPVSSKNEVYLTFDDGPIPEITPWVLDQLKKHNAKATFFCIGDNVKKYPEVFQSVIYEGHSVGNHTFHHLSGWKTEAKKYIENVQLAETELLKLQNSQSNATPTKLFRPPYGRMTSRQSKMVRDLGYQIIMWDVLSGDFDAKISEEKCFQNVSENLAPGSIVVFHDSLKAENNLRFCLPKILEFITEKGWKASLI